MLLAEELGAVVGLYSSIFGLCEEAMLVSMVKILCLV